MGCFWADNVNTQEDGGFCNANVTPPGPVVRVNNLLDYESPYDTECLSHPYYTLPVVHDGDIMTVVDGVLWTTIPFTESTCFSDNNSNLLGGTDNIPFSADDGYLPQGTGDNPEIIDGCFPGFEGRLYEGCGCGYMAPTVVGGKNVISFAEASYVSYNSLRSFPAQVGAQIRANGDFVRAFPDVIVSSSVNIWAKYLAVRHEPSNFTFWVANYIHITKWCY